MQSKQLRDSSTRSRPTAAGTTPDPRADAWAAKNTWFGTDNAMTYTAFDIHRKLVEEEGLTLHQMNIILRLTNE